MSKVILTLKRHISAPVHLDTLTPDRVWGRKVTELANEEVWEGNRRIKIKTLFNIEGNIADKPDDIALEIIGDLSRTRSIGYKMTAGTLNIRGTGGLYIGESMSGGNIIVEGDAGSWLGSNMRGGTIEVSGRTGDFVGAASRGTTKGMMGGTITLKGDAGNQVGAWMNSGTIRILGNSEMTPGIHMTGGTIHISGDCSGRAGAQMKGGKIIISGNMQAPLPSFSFEEIREQTKIEKESVRGPFYVFSGDNNEDGNGKLFINVERNSQLRWYEKFLEV